MQFLALDLGNTTVRAARFSGSRLLARASWPTNKSPPPGFDLGNDDEAPEAAGLASVNREAEASVLSWLTSLDLRAFRIPGDLPFPIPVALIRPGLVGPDRVLASAAALDRLGGPCIVVDAGTAVTVDFATPGEGFQGGAILPGRHLMARALREGTSRLPRVPPDPVDDPLGRSTEEAIRAGTFLGWIGAVREMVGRLLAKVGRAEVVATGGDGEILAARIEAIREVLPDLTLQGIRLALEKGARDGRLP